MHGYECCARPFVCKGLRHWIKYIEITHGERHVDTATFPPDVNDVLGWSNTFKSACSEGPCTLRLCALLRTGVLERSPIIWDIYVERVTHWASKRPLWGMVPSSVP